MQTSLLPPRAPRSLDPMNVARFEPIIRKVASKMAARLPPVVRREDLIGSGWVGALEALARADREDQDGQLDAYVTIRARGAMLDYLRTLDIASRGVRARARRMRAAANRVTTATGREATAEEIASEMGIGVEGLHDITHSVDLVKVEHLEDSPTGADVADASLDPEAAVHHKLLVGSMAHAIRKLPERLQTVLSLYYEHSCTLAEIGATLGVTESRACQLHGEAIRRLRAEMPSA